MKVVIDSNVFVSSFFGGNPKKIIDFWKQGKIILCLSGPILDEYIAVLRRMGFTDRKGLQRLLDLFAQGFNSLFTAKTPNLSIVKEYPDDDKFLECAVAIGAHCIISGDKSVTDVKEYIGIKIFTPSQFLKEYATL